jgi:hypothetical protein
MLLLHYQLLLIYYLKLWLENESYTIFAFLMLFLAFHGGNAALQGGFGAE